MPNKEIVETLPLDITTGQTYSISQRNPNSYTHGMFKYPCKFIPEIPRWALSKYATKGKETIVFDPFAGSGTTLLESNVFGYDAYGTEIDEVARLIIKVKTFRYSKEDVENIETYFSNLFKKDKGVNNCYRPQISNLEHWFSEKTISTLCYLREQIENIPDEPGQSFFKLCFASIIKKVSYADDSSPKPYVSSKIKKIPPDAFDEFSNVYTKYKKMIEETSELKEFGATTIVEGDALNFELTQQIDLAITSPPYINAFDYGRTMRLENLWLGLLTEEELREKKAKYVGTEKIRMTEEENNYDVIKRSPLLKDAYLEILERDKRKAFIVKRFFSDMEKNLAAISSNMPIGAKYVIIIGNSKIKKVLVESWRILSELAVYKGFKVLDYYSYEIQNPYIRIPRKGRGGEIKKDYVLVLEKEKDNGSRE